MFPTKSHEILVFGNTCHLEKKLQQFVCNYFLFYMKMIPLFFLMGGKPEVECKAYCNYP